MPSRPLPAFLNAQDVQGNSLDWLRISRDEALRLASRGISVVTVSGYPGAVSPFDSSAPWWHASGPYDYASLRYFAYRPSFGPAQPMGPGRPAGRSGAAKAQSGVVGAAEGEDALLEAVDEPMESSAKKGSLFNLVWLTDRDGEEVEISAAGSGDKVRLRVESQRLMPGDSLQFQIFKEGSDKPLAQLYGQLGDNRAADLAAVDWTVPVKAGGQDWMAGDCLVACCRFARQGIECRSPSLSIGTPHEEGLRFDLALDPATPELAGDVFVLEGIDSEYRQARTVRDDKVAGDGRLTLIFTEVAQGRKYRLSQVQGEAEIILVPEVVYSGPAAQADSAGPAPAPAAQTSGSRSKSAPPPAAGHVVGCKAVFRECRIQTESTDLWKMRETQYQFELAYAKDKWVYVFGGPQGGPLALIAEGLGTADGGFRPVDLKTHRGKDGREASRAASAWITLPLKVNGREWDLYACLSPIPLPWKRVAEIEKNPLPRCYKLGDNVGGVCWVPGHVGREVPRLSKAWDPRIADPGKDIVMLGLMDYMAEARRRAGIFRRELEPYLENRFDAPIDGTASPEQVARRRKKHVAGLIKVVLEKHPRRRQLQECLALNGAALDQFLRDEDEREIALKKRFSGAAAALVKWMDSPSKVFDSVVADYFADPGVQEHMRKAEEEIAFLTAYFEASSLTRLFGQRMLDLEESWVNRFVLDPNRFQAMRETTVATVEILNWLSGVVVRSKKKRTDKLATLYHLLLDGVEVRAAGIHMSGVGYEIEKTEENLWFPDESKIKPGRGRKENFKTLRAKDRVILYKVVQINKASKPFKRLEAVTKSSVMQGVLYGLEVNNSMLALRELNQDVNYRTGLNSIGAGADLLSFILETAAEAGARIGRGSLAIVALGSSFLDYLVALEESGDAYVSGDYDQMVAKIGMAVGSASMVVGAALVATSVFSTMTAGTGLLSAGLGLSMTGAGTVPGAVAFLLGATLYAGSTILSQLVIQDEFHIWMSECPFGTLPAWAPEDRIAPIQIAAFYEMLHPVKLDVRHVPSRDMGRFVITFQGPWNPFTEIKIDSLELVDSQLRTSRILRQETLSEGSGEGYEIETEAGDLQKIHLRLSNEKCWEGHRKEFPDFDFRFKYARLYLKIDLYGDNELLLPSRAVKRPVILPIS